MVVLHALGQCLIRTSIATIGPRAELGFALATRLIADRGRRLTRRHLTALFWPDAEEQRAAHSLSEALHRLRARGLPIESDSSHAVWIARDAATVDVERIPELPPQDLARCDFTVLPGFDPRWSPELMDWADEFRHQLRVQTARNTAAVIRRAEREGDWADALALAEHLLRFDPDDLDALATRARAAEALRAARGAESKPSRSARPLAEPRAEPRALAVREASARPCPVPAPPNFRPHGAFVDRVEELRILRDAWEKTRRGRGGRISVFGASGIGKTRLVRHFSEIAGRGGAVVAEVSCDPGDGRRPLSAFMRLVPRLLNLPGAAGCSPDLRPYLDRLTEFDSGETKWPEASDTRYMLSCIERAIDELIDAVADEQPLVIVFDNAHWADEESLRLIETIALSASARAVLVVSISCEPAREPLAAACVPTIPITVGPLPDPAARAIVLDRSSTHGQAPDDPIVEWLVRAGEGNPLRLEEMVSHWASGGAPFELPASLAALLKNRVERLGVEARRVMQVVALLGRQATLDRVERVTALERGAFIAAVEQLGADGLLVTDTSGDPMPASGGPVHVACRHEAIARAVLAELSDPARALLHRDIAMALDTESSRSADVLWDRAAHWSGGHELPDVVRTTVSCARHLAAVGLADAGAAACRQLLAAPLPDVARRDALTALAHTLHLGWNWAELRAVVADLREMDGGGDVHDDVELCLLDAKWQMQEDPDAVLESAMRCANASCAPAAHRVRAAGIAIKLATNAGRPAAVRQAFESVVSILNQPDVDAGDRLSVEMMFHAVGGSLPLAQRCAHALVRMSTLLPEPSRLRALCNSAATLARAGSLREALALCEAATHDAIRRQLTPLATAACHRAANICLDAGEPELASQWVDRFATHASPRDAYRQKAVLLALARIAFHRGEFDDALNYLAPDGVPLWRDATAAFTATALATEIATSASCGNDPAAIRELLARVLPLHRRLQGMGAHDFVAAAIALGYESIGEGDRATSLFGTYLTQHRREPFPLPGRFAAMVSVPTGV